MSDKIEILLVEDDIDLGQMLKLYLELDRFNVLVATTSGEGLEYFKKQKFSIGIIDINLPDRDGFSLAKDIRKTDVSFPFIFLTARTLKQDKIKGLKLGADDYITKPFDAEELILRINNILSRTGVQKQSIIKFSNFSLDMDELQLTHPVKSQKMTRREAELLYYFASNQNKLIRTADILSDLWGEDDYFLGRSMNVFVSRLRKYLSLEPSITIRNLRGEGYEFGCG